MNNTGLNKMRWLAFVATVCLRGVSATLPLRAQDIQDFRQADSLTYQLYQQQDWRALALASRDALRAGHDYYYLRLRMGIAQFNLGHYRMAAEHFEKALLFNSGDAAGRDYLKASYEYSLLYPQAARLEKRFPRPKHYLRDEIVKGFELFAGGAVSGGQASFNRLDIDGPTNLYGEGIGNGNLFYGYAALAFAPAEHLYWHAGFTSLQLARCQRIVFDGADTLEKTYWLRQQQLSGRFPMVIGGTWIVTPALSLMLITDQPYQVSWDKKNSKYIIQRSQVVTANYVVSLRLAKELPHAGIALMVGNSYLNTSTQWQASVMTNVYPLANMNLYLISRVSAFSDNNSLRWNSKLGVGARITDFLWAQGAHLFGSLKNTYDEDLLVVFNTIGTVLSRSTFSAYLLIRNNLTLQLDYSMMRQRDQYVSFSSSTTSISQSYNYINHHLMGGLKWKF